MKYDVTKILFIVLSWTIFYIVSKFVRFWLINQFVVGYFDYIKNNLGIMKSLLYYISF